jgi:tRNA pseudouridine55 synthase
MSEIRGIFNIFKPSGMTSFDVVKFVRRVTGIRRVGHTGTLDPSASGVLPVCVGAATKVIQFIPDNKKEYIAELILGVKTDSLDGEGNIIDSNEYWRKLDEKEIRSVFEHFQGEIAQVPPMYSALHYQGKRLYKLARSGQEVIREPRRVKIEEIEILDISLPLISFRVLCSAGTYIRSLTSDIGDELGTGAHLSSLIRTRSGPFRIERSITLKELKEKGADLILSPDYPLDYPVIRVKPSAEKMASNGVTLSQDDIINCPDNLKNGDMVLVYDREDTLISLNRLNYVTDYDIEYKPLRVFNFRSGDI